MNQLLQFALLPFSYMYGTIVWFRNLLFDYKILASKEFKLPVISIGNITVGGTGKTPHTEYLIRLLKNDFTIAVLSRGYMRKTNNFRLVNVNSTFEEVGDEPLQIKHKFADILVAVDRKRVNGIEKILENEPGTDIVLLDDAFQHRWVTPGINILLIDYNRPLNKDYLLPAGRLRESSSEMSRADIIIVTKTPQNLSAMDKRLLLSNTGAKPYQHIYFTSIKYGSPEPVFNEPDSDVVDFSDTDLSVLVVTGIANPSTLLSELGTKYKTIEHIQFTDHYAFNVEDIQKIQNKLEQLAGNKKIVITTEKDAARLANFEYQITKRGLWYYIPIEVEFHSGQAEQFNKQILHYVTNNSRNSLLYKK